MCPCGAVVRVVPVVAVVVRRGRGEGEGGEGGRGGRSHSSRVGRGRFLSRPPPPAATAAVPPWIKGRRLPRRVRRGFRFSRLHLDDDDDHDEGDVGSLPPALVPPGEGNERILAGGGEGGG